MLADKFWTSQTVLVTGHTGFKGSWLSLWLQELGARVVGYSLPPPTTPNLFDLARVKDGMVSLTGDVRDVEGIQRAIAEHRPSVVFHLAAQPLVRQSYRQPLETYSTNVMGTAAVLEAVRTRGGVRAVVVVTSDKCYENRGWVWGYRETEPLGGHDPYSSSKGCAEIVTEAYRRSFFNPGDYDRHGTGVASVRAGNAIGGGDWAQDRLIPDTMRAFLEKRPVLIRRPQAVRPWQHVLEPLAGYLEVARRLVMEGCPFAEAWNFGPSDDDARPVSWIVDRLVSLWGNGAQWRVDGAEHLPEATVLRLDSSKARGRLGWRPRWNLETALAKSVDWYRAYQDRGDLRATTLAQVEAYANAL